MAARARPCSAWCQCRAYARPSARGCALSITTRAFLLRQRRRRRRRREPALQPPGAGGLPLYPHIAALAAAVTSSKACSDSDDSDASPAPAATAAAAPAASAPSPRRRPPPIYSGYHAGSRAQDEAETARRSAAAFVSSASRTAPGRPAAPSRSALSLLPAARPGPPGVPARQTLPRLSPRAGPASSGCKPPIPPTPNRFACRRPSVLIPTPASPLPPTRLPPCAP